MLIVKKSPINTTNNIQEIIEINSQKLWIVFISLTLIHTWMYHHYSFITSQTGSTEIPSKNVFLTEMINLNEKNENEKRNDKALFITFIASNFNTNQGIIFLVVFQIKFLLPNPKLWNQMGQRKYFRYPVTLFKLTHEPFKIWERRNLKRIERISWNIRLFKHLFSHWSFSR